MKKRKLGTKVIILMVAFSLLIIVSTCIAVVVRYRADALERSRRQAFAYAKTAAAYIDGDRIEGYLTTLQKDDYYEEVEDFLNASQDYSDLKYYYVYVPYEEDLVYIWDANEEEGACELGDHEDYMKGGKEVSFAAFQKEPEERALVSVDETYGFITSVVAPVYNSNGDPVALVGVDISMPGVWEAIAKFIFATSINIVLVILVFSAGLFAVVRQKLIHPVSLLNKASGEMVSNLESGEVFEIDVHTGDEIEELARSFEKMYGEVGDYIRRLSEVTAEKERIGAELSVATRIQANMLPSIFPPFPDRKDMDIYATMHPAKEVGGDFYDFFLIDSSHLGVVIADVSGKGVPAALFMVIAKTLIKNRALMGGTPAEILAFVNNQLCENNEEEMFVTVWLGILDLTTGLMTAANAGHEYPVLKRAGGEFELFKDKHGFVLAGMEDSGYRDYEIRLAPGDMLFVYTDGVPEATNAQKELYRTDRMVEALNRHASEGCESLLHEMKEEIQSFVQEAPQFDDITMLALTYYGPEAAEPEQ